MEDMTFNKNDLQSIIWNLVNPSYELILDQLIFGQTLNLLQKIDQATKQKSCQCSQNHQTCGQIQSKTKRCQENVGVQQNPKMGKKQLRVNKQVKYKQKIEKKQKKQRKNDQNMCKKYNKVALKIIIKLLQNDVSRMSKHIIHRKDFLILMMIYAQKYAVLDQFKIQYVAEVNKMIDQLTEQRQRNKQKQKKKQDLLKGIKNSIQAISKYSQGNREQARMKLFNKKLRNNKFLEDSRLFIEQAQKNLKKIRDSNI